jgi:hypothetical protein
MDSALLGPDLVSAVRSSARLIDSLAMLTRMSSSLPAEGTRLRKPSESEAMETVLVARGREKAKMNRERAKMNRLPYFLNRQREILNRQPYFLNRERATMNRSWLAMNRPRDILNRQLLTNDSRLFFLDSKRATENPS